MKKSGFKLTMLILMMALLLAASGCGAIKDKVSEKVSEGIIEGALGGKVDIEEGGSKITFEEGQMEVGEDLEWPKDAMGNLPVPKAKITFIMKDDSTGTCGVTLSEFALQDAKKYLEEITALGFKDGMNIKDETSFMYTGKRDDGSGILFSYTVEAKEGVISFEKPK